MDDALAVKEIAELKMNITKEEQNYFNAVQRDVEFHALKKKRLHIRGLQHQLQFLLKEDMVSADLNKTATGLTE